MQVDVQDAARMIADEAILRTLVGVVAKLGWPADPREGVAQMEHIALDTVTGHDLLPGLPKETNEEIANFVHKRVQRIFSGAEFD